MQLQTSVGKNIIAQLLTIEGAKISETPFDQGIAKFDVKFNVSKLPTGSYQVLVFSNGVVISNKRIVIVH